MDYAVIQESFDSLASCWADPNHQLRWNPVFVLPTWLNVWWQEFKPEAEPYLISIRQGEKIIGIAPLLIKEDSASIIGSADVCDYLDFIVTAGMEEDFFSTLLNDLRKKGVKHLDLGPLRPDSTVLTSLVGIAEKQGYDVVCQPEDVSLEIDLSATWDEYLATLDKKQRHEVRRKLRRLWETGTVEYRCLESDQASEDIMDTFLKLFVLSRQEKADFMTARMESFFRSLAKAMTEIGLLKYGILEVDKLPVAMTMGFDYDDTIYLYNSAYDPQFNPLSVGVLSKALCIKKSIEEGKNKFDLLKGNEIYKYHLGGKEIPLSRCQITAR
jgi:CelD/BcsL family acetyltransferase involved in cellulose biosynthesis